MRKLLALIVLISNQMACASTVVVDRSPQAIESGDYTLAMSACSAMPGLGADVCHVKEGQNIDASWRLIMPNGTKGGQIDVYYRDISKSYPILSTIVEVPLKDLIGSDVWKRDYDGEMLALAQVRYIDPQGIEQVARARGMLFLIVTAVGYDPLAIDSGFAATKTRCDIYYSTAGRSAMSCK